MQVGAMIGNGQIPALQPFEVSGIGQHDLRVAVGMRDDVKADRLAHGVQEVDDHFQLLLHRVEMGEEFKEFGAEEFRIDLPARHAVEAGHDARFPDGQQVNGILCSRQGEGVFHDIPERLDGAHVDADHIGTAQPRGRSIPGAGAGFGVLRIEQAPHPGCAQAR